MDIIQQLTRDEGVRLRLYSDTSGKLTIGVGRNLTDVGIRQSEANFMLQNDVDEVEHNLSIALPWVSNLDDVRKFALVNMAFNMGLHGLVSFHNTLTFMEKGDYASASVEMLKSHWAAQVGDRAKRLSEQIKTGEWQ